VARVAVRFETLAVDDATLAALTRLLGADERARADRFRFPRDRRRFVVRRACLRQILGAEIGRAPEALVFAENSHGKPVLEGGPPFSLSHSADMMMLAIGDAELGCDIERIDPALDWLPLAESLFTAAERAALGALPPEAGRRAFFACWARKEAFVKALGLGLSYPLDAFTVSVGVKPALVSGGEGWAIGTGPVVPGYATAIVARDDGTPLALTVLTSQQRAAA
jgi:4'-phosphopantetheinyl transferase